MSLVSSQGSVLTHNYYYQPSKYMVCVKAKRDESLLYLVKFGKLKAIVGRNFVSNCVEVFTIEAKLKV